VIGTILAHYQVTERIGAGGMGEVYRARDETLGRDVAIKILPSGVAIDPERLSRLEREAKLLAALNHPNIASIHSFEEADGRRFLVLEFVEGEDLSHRLERGPLPVDEALGIAGQIAQALEEAHEKGIVHRDLKPGNVKLTPDGKVKVLDFGLAKAWTVDAGSGSASNLSRSPTLTHAGTEAGVILGTAAYMSPEQARGRPVDKRADVWAFGVVLFEMLTGRRMFAGETVTDVLAAVLTSEVPLGTLPGAVPPPIRRLLRRCLERNARNRLHDIADARIVIDEVVAGRGEEPGPGTPPPRSRRRTALLAGAVPLAAALGALVTLAVRPDRPPPEPVRIKRLTYSGHDQQPSVSPDGRFVAFASGREGLSRIWLKQLKGGGEQRLTEGPDFRPHFAPDGNSVGYLHEVAPGRYDLYRTALVGGQPRRLVSDVSDFDWSPDGRSVAFTRHIEDPGRGEGWALRVVELEHAGRERGLLEGYGWVLLGPRWRPDGGRIAITRGAVTNSAGGWKLLLVDPVTGASEDLGAGEGVGMISSSAWDHQGAGLVYAASPNDIGDLTGAPATVRLLRPGAAPRTVFWASGLFPQGGFPPYSAVLSILGPNRVVFDAFEQSQELREVDVVGGATRQLTRTLATDRQPAYSPDGRFVVFSSNRTGNLDLWLLDRGSRALRQLTDDASQDWDPGFSADGRRVLFSSSRGGHLEIWSIDVDGSNARQLSHDGVDAENPTTPRDGRWVVYSSGNPDHLGLFRMRPDGSEATQITTGNHTTPEVSPDARWAQFVSTMGLSAQVRFVEIETGRLAPAAIDLGSTMRATSISLGRGRWTRNGAAVAYAGVDDRGRTGIFEQEFDPDHDTAATRRPLAGFFDDLQTESFGVAPDGSTVTLAVIRETRSLMLAEGLPEDPP
jgi:Tol biopolymer transport system component/tRNA A-37 threonylcarbamoyl transferase component Bud32